MTRSIHIRSFVITSAFAAAAAMALAAQTGAASAKKVASCEGPSRQSVIECCETLVQRNGMPMWMQQTGRNCRQAAVCRGGPNQPTTAAARRCWINIHYDQVGKHQERERKGRNN